MSEFGRVFLLLFSDLSSSLLHDAVPDELLEEGGDDLS